MDKDKVLIFDTTLRDGEQSPGATLNINEKIEIAKQLTRLGVDIIEAGFPISSPGDFEAVRRIAAEIGHDDTRSSGPPIIAGLARAHEPDILRAWEAVQVAKRPRIHTFLATSDIHMEHKLRLSRDQVVDRVRRMVTLAASLTADVEFSPEDAGRSDPNFLYEVLAVAIECGATTLNIPDTVGYLTPDEYAALLAGIMRHTPGATKVVFSAHCHDDLGLATANTLAAIKAGVRQAEVTMNGIGERAGNTSLEEVVMALHTRPQFYHLSTNIDTTQITRTSRMVSSYTGIQVQPNKAIVGANAFAHEAGIHQDGMLKNATTYEIMQPETVGLTESKLVLGKHSGRHAFNQRMTALGYDLAPSDLERVFLRFKELCDKKKLVDDRDIEAMVSDEIYQPAEVYSLELVQVSCGDHSIATATVQVRKPSGEVVSDAALGTGPVDAVYRAINRVVMQPNQLTEFSIKAITEGIDAQAEVTIRIEAEEDLPDHRRSFTGHGAHTDTLVAAAKAYMSALNKLIGARREAGLPAPGVAQPGAYSPALVPAK